MIKKENFGKFDGKEVSLYTLTGSDGLTVCITDFGGIIRNIFYKGHDVVLGCDTLEDYKTTPGNLGALIGRNSNRIANAEFELDGKTYKLLKNDGNNNLHGGAPGFNAKLWDSEAIDGDEPSIVLTLKSPDGEAGFPGNADIKVTYTVTAQNSLKIHYEAVCDANTLMNLTNHSYFNMNGHESGTTGGHTIEVMADFFTPNSDECMPTGEILSVSGRAFDLRKPTKMSHVYTSDDEQVKLFGGFDHNFCLRGRGFRKVASITGDKSGITMETYTDLPGVQIYTGNFLDGAVACKDGIKYDMHYGICFETQFFPNTPAISHFPSTVLKKGDKYDTTTEYKFV